MNVLLLGSGGREHALAWKLSQSPILSKLFIAPGNPGTATLGENVDVNPVDFAAIKQLVITKSIEMVVVGPEDPLVKGVHDFFLADDDLKHIPVIGPTRAGAMLEGSKDFSKGFMMRHGIPTAQYKSFCSSQKDDAMLFLKTLKPPYVLKADGLAAGKGVVISSDLIEAEDTLNQMFGGEFGDAGNTVVIEEFLQGIEVSVFVLTDGDGYVILPEAKDYKRIGEGDTGPNTGGMGAVSPVPFANAEFMAKVDERIVKPTIEGLKVEGIPYKGFIFVGLMNVSGDPFVIEYNARMGDPETQVVMPRLKTDLLELLVLTSQGKLSEAEVEFNSQSATAVILVSGGYPGDYSKGKIVSGEFAIDNGLAFHAGTKYVGDKLVTSGGRVMACVGIANSTSSALEVSYSLASKIDFENKYFRRDIGKDLV
ncbi:phosphoribosylamine--glycine ligase [Perlabentimonas gracilis]|uniref:phosphoribosylamine--glycine ligase n=1 Tax=Perlabentimonas gracilis TaxID=2715279 RepID=UPI00140A4B3A|nr:phosphoribosylamine--glycine ligase [Perlabentimonas gracilis]NHB67681.1 phosphoribosylamine--glycine ligase [Perlabentimonas gracilis]